MSWLCKVVEEPKGEIGEMWYLTAMIEGEYRQHYLDHVLSNEYKRDWLEKRPPIRVLLPGMKHGIIFDIDSRTSNSKDGSGWIVTGELPVITLKPSINIIGFYHGFITDGIITDDIEGRTYEINNCT